MKRKTPQREAVRRAVYETLDHPTAAEVYTFLRTDHPRISMGTVYRDLGDLVSDGEIIRLETPDGIDRYDKTVTAHYHIVCTKCGGFSDIDIPYGEDFDMSAERLSGFSAVSHQLVFKGLCPECTKKKIK